MSNSNNNQLNIPQACEASPIDWIMGCPDNLKLRSCMTLFYLVSNENAFKEVLDKFYASEMDEFTKRKLA